MSLIAHPRPANGAGPAFSAPWPNGARCAVFPGFDVDAESVWLGGDPRNDGRLVTLSYGGYEARVGVPRILDLLDRHGVTATFFVTGWSVDAHPAMAEAILRAGHEIAHHGYGHLRPEPDDAAAAIEEVERGLDALKRVLGVVPVGYRAPSGESFTELLQALRDRGIRYSSSWRDDVRPYRHVLPDGPGPIEIPVNFALDDWNYGMTHRSGPRTLVGREDVLSIWRDEFDATREWGGVATLILHPQVSGRPMRLKVLDDFLTHVRRFDDVWWATGREICDWAEAAERADGQGGGTLA